MITYCLASSFTVTILHSLYFFQEKLKTVTESLLFLRANSENRLHERFNRVERHPIHRAGYSGYTDSAECCSKFNETLTIGLTGFVYHRHPEILSSQLKGTSEDYLMILFTKFGRAKEPKWMSLL